MTLKQKIDRAALRVAFDDGDVTLTAVEIRAVSALLDWAEHILEDINAEGAETLGGNSVLSAFEEEV